MSKGINMFNHFNPPKADGHKIVGITSSSHTPTVYCPKIKDNTEGNEPVSKLVDGTHTSNGIICSHCGKMLY